MLVVRKFSFKHRDLISDFRFAFGVWIRDIREIAVKKQLFKLNYHGVACGQLFAATPHFRLLIETALHSGVFTLSLTRGSVWRSLQRTKNWFDQERKTERLM
jgi:hypothetical protein